MTDRHPSFGRIVTGLLLVALGVLWLLDEFVGLDLPWTGLLAAGLIVVGAALMFGASSGPHGGLVTLGVVLSILVVGSSAFGVLTDVPFRGGVGERDYAPIAVADEYRLAVGSMQVDLTAATLSGQTVVMSVGIGELVVIVPADAAVTIVAAAGIGEVVVFEEVQSGFGAEVDHPAAGPADITLEVRAGIGKVEVRRP